MPRPRKYKNFELTGQQRMAAIARLLALGIVRLASRELAEKERETTGLKTPSKHSSKQLSKLKRKGK